MLKNLYKRFVQRHGHAVLAFLLFIGQLSAGLACKGDFYQPEVPEQLLGK